MSVKGYGLGLLPLLHPADLSCLVIVLCCLLLSGLVLSCLVLSCLVLAWLGLAWLALPCLVLSYGVLCCLLCLSGVQDSYSDEQNADDDAQRHPPLLPSFFLSCFGKRQKQRLRKRLGLRLRLIG